MGAQIKIGITICRNRPERAGTDRNGPERTGTDSENSTADRFEPSFCLLAKISWQERPERAKKIGKWACFYLLA